MGSRFLNRRVESSNTGSPYLNKQPTRVPWTWIFRIPVIVHDTIFYTFYIVDRNFNQSNTDTTDVIVLSGIDLEDY